MPPTACGAPLGGCRVDEDADVSNATHREPPSKRREPDTKSGPLQSFLLFVVYHI